MVDGSISFGEAAGPRCRSAPGGCPSRRGRSFLEGHVETGPPQPHLPCAEGHALQPCQCTSAGTGSSFRFAILPSLLREGEPPPPPQESHSAKAAREVHLRGAQELQMGPFSWVTALVDGSHIASTNFVTIGTSGFYGAQIPVTNGVHTVTSSQPVGVEVYGFGSTDAYGYSGGIVK